MAEVVGVVGADPVDRHALGEEVVPQLLGGGVAGVAEAVDGGVTVVELEEVEFLDGQHVLGLYGPSEVWMIEDGGAAGLDGFIDVTLDDLGAMLVIEVPWHEAVYVHGRAVDGFASRDFFPG